MRRATALTLLWYGGGLLIGFAISCELVSGWLVAKTVAAVSGFVLVLIGGGSAAEADS